MARPLPAGQCIRHALTSVRNNLAYAFRISWPWYAVFVPVVIVLSALLGYWTGGNPEALPGLSFLINILIGLVTLLAFSSIAVNWHRYILLDEVPRGAEIFRLDDKTWRYFGNLLLISLFAFLVGIAIGFPLGFIGGLIGAIEIFTALIIIIALPVIGVLVLRLSIKLPAIALGDSNFRMRDAWNASRDNTLPIFLVFLFEALLAAAAWLIPAAFALAANTVSATLGFVLAFAIRLVMNWIFTIFSITVLTSLYGFFVENRDF